MADRQRNGDESFFEGHLGGLEEEGKGRREACTRFNPRPGGGGGRRRARGRLYTGAGFPDGGYVQGQEGHTYKSVHASSGHNLYE